MSGVGTFVWADGTKYVGKFKSHCRNDTQGVLTWPNGDVYEGGFVNGMFEGDALCKYA